jgi:hypothetical protein
MKVSVMYVHLEFESYVIDILSDTVGSYKLTHDIKEISYQFSLVIVDCFVSFD